MGFLTRLMETKPVAFLLPRSAPRLSRMTKLPDPKFKLGDYIYASDNPDCGQGTIIRITWMGEWQYSISVPGSEERNVVWSEKYLTLVPRPLMDAGAEEYELIMAGQELLND